MAVVPWEDIPDYAVLPHDIYTMAVQNLDVTHSKKGTLMVAATFEVVQPTSYAGMTHREWYVLGNDDDPEAEDPETWKRQSGARNLKRLAKATGAVLDPELETTCQNLLGQQFDVLVIQETEKGGEYDGRIRNRIQSYYACGEQVPGSLSTSSGRRPAPASAARPATRPAPTRPVAAATRPVARPQAVEAEEEYETEEVSARPPMPTRSLPPRR